VKEMEKQLYPLKFALALPYFWFILVIGFHNLNSLLHPLLILFTVPLALLQLGLTVCI